MIEHVNSDTLMANPLSKDLSPKFLMSMLLGWVL